MSPVKKATNTRKRNTGSARKRAIPRAASTQPAAEPAPSPIAVAKGIGAYLEECRAGGPPSGRIALGALPGGFPSVTDDPEVIRRAITYYEAKVPDAPTAMKELLIHQRIRDLNLALHALNGGATTHRDFFVKYAASYAAKRGIDYETFRMMGVPADVLKDAGMGRSGLHVSTNGSQRRRAEYSPETREKFRENAAKARAAKARKQEAALRATATRKTATKKTAKKKTTKKTAKRR